jgi:enoyl reductase-like protein
MPTTDKTISQIFEEFLNDQEARLSPNTFSKYQTIIELFESYMESY